MYIDDCKPNRDIKRFIVTTKSIIELRNFNETRCHITWLGIKHAKIKTSEKSLRWDVIEQFVRIKSGEKPSGVGKIVFKQFFFAIIEWFIMKFVSY